MAEPAKPDRDMGIDVDELRRSMAAAGLRIVAGPGPLREVLPEAITELTGEPLTAVHCDHWQNGDGACCRCGEPNWCPDGGETEAALELPARRQHCPSAGGPAAG